MHWFANNVDINVKTFDDTGTFHGMSIIAAVTSENQNDAFHTYKISTNRRKVNDIVKNKGISIVKYVEKATPSSMLKFKPHASLQSIISCNPGKFRKLMWLSSWSLLGKESRNSN